MNKVILISILLFLFVLLLYNYKEDFTLSQMQDNNDIQALFCKKLEYLDEPSEELKIFLDQMNDVEKGYNKKITFLESEIKRIQDSINNKDINIVRHTRKKNKENRDKQLEIINMADNNLKSLNNPNLNFNIK